MSNKIYWLVWVTFLAYSILLSPRNDASTRSTSLYVQQLMFGPWNGIDPYVISLFYFLGKFDTNCNVKKQDFLKLLIDCV